MSSVLYYSKYCDYCKELLYEIGKSDIQNKIHFLSIDKRKRHGDKMFIVLDNGKEIFLPSNISGLSPIRVIFCLTTQMGIPISNILYGKKNQVLNIKKIDLKKLNTLNFQDVNSNRFPSVKLINKCLNLGTLAPTILNASNEVLVDLFLSNKIGFLDIVKKINVIFKDKDFNKYARRNLSTIKDIKMADNWARLKTKDMCVR